MFISLSCCIFNLLVNEYLYPPIYPNSYSFSISVFCFSNCFLWTDVFTISVVVVPGNILNDALQVLVSHLIDLRVFGLNGVTSGRPMRHSI